MTIPAPPTGVRFGPLADPHAYFDALRARPDCWQAFSLRDAAQCVSFKHSDVLPPGVTYDPLNDPDPRRQDAAKVIVPGDVTILTNQLRIPMHTELGHRYLVTWDYWCGAEWNFAHTAIGNCKQFQFGSPTGAWWLQTNAHWQAAAPGTLALLDVRGHDWTPATITPPVVRYLMPERWTRIWWLLDQPTSDPANLHATLWWGDTQQAPTQLWADLTVAYGVDPTTGQTRASIGEWWIEFNTSANVQNIPPGRGPLIAYVRNVVMLKDPDVSTLTFEAPLG